MSTTDELLEEMLEDVEEYATPVTDDDLQFWIDEHLRVISIPKNGVVAGVEGDKNVNKIKFGMNRYYHGFDMSTFSGRILYSNAKGNKNYYNITDMQTSGNIITFSWLVDADAVQYMGKTAFVVYLFKTQGSELRQKFYSTLATLKVLEGMEVDSAVPVEKQTDIIERLKEEISAYAEEVKKSLPADYTAMTEQVSSLKEDINGMGTKHINYLLSLQRIPNKFYNHKSTSIATAGENVKTEIYKEIPIKKGIKYYYKNFYAYFCNIVYNDGSIVALSETSNSYVSGTFIAEKDGKILITVSLSQPAQQFIFTDDEKTVKYYNFNENVYESTGLRSLFVEPVLIEKTNYKDILPDCNNAKIGGVYRFIFPVNETEIPKNTPLGDSYNVTCICLLMCFGKMNTGVSLGDYQLFFSDGTIYRRQYSAKLSSDGATYEYYWGNWTIVAQRNEDPVITPKTIVVDKNGNGVYTSLLRGILYATTFMDSTVYVKTGEYDLVSEFEDYYGSDFFTNYSSSDVKGIILKNRVNVIFDTRAHVTFNYTGNNNNVKSIFSPFNSGVYGFTLDNLQLEASNCRYNIHDERGSATDGYKNVYKNCSLYLDNSGNTGWSSKQCIGGGLGANGDIVVENCIFESIGISDSGYGIVSWHNSASNTAKSNIVISGNYFKGKGTFRLSWYGKSTDITNALVSNNSFGSAIQSRAETSDESSANVNTEIIEWNNVIRTD